jgi:hypothetical protein
MIQWEQGGPKPEGDDVVTPATVANANYGCKFTVNTLGPDESTTFNASRPGVAAAKPCTP